MFKRVFSHRFDIVPVVKKRPIVRKNGWTVPHPKSKKYETELRAMIQSVWKHPPISGPVVIKVVFDFVLPKSVKKREYHTVSCDLDNLVKGQADAANTVLYLDDRQIVSLQASKRYAPTFGVKIVMYALES